ncbi:hypothetical protein [Methanococcus sp. CF]
MGEGKCGKHEYSNINQQKVDLMIEELKEHGISVTGNNPWVIDPKKFSIKLQATWDKESSKLYVIVTDKSFLVPCSKIWDTIDPLINNIQGLSEDEMK